MRKHRQFACAATLVAALAMAAPAAAAPQVDTSALRNAVTYDGIHEHLAALQARAVPYEDGAPTRATGTVGHWNSVDYVVERLRAAGYQPQLQRFDADIFVEESAAFARDGVPYQRYDGEAGVWYTADFSGTGEATAAAVAVDFTPPTDQASASDSGCEAADFGPEVVGKVVLLQRGTCDFGLKAQLAGEAGAIGAVIFDEGTVGQADRNDVLIPTLAGYTVTIPVVGTDYATGFELVQASQAPGGVTVTVNVQGIVQQDVPTANVIAETPGGRADRTVVVGGHLDSVFEGPGINDDGSASGRSSRRPRRWPTCPPRGTRCVHLLQRRGAGPARLGVLRLARAARQEGDPGHLRDARLRHARVEELRAPDLRRQRRRARLRRAERLGRGRAGVQGLVRQPGPELPDDPVRRALGLRRVHDRRGPGRWHLRRREELKTAEQVTLFGGILGEPLDPCYHQACDTLTNISEVALTQHKDAAVHDVDTFAQTTSSVNGTGKASSSSTKAWDWKGDHQVR